MKKALMGALGGVLLTALGALGGCNRAQPQPAPEPEPVDTIAAPRLLDIVLDSLALDDYQVRSGESLAIILGRLGIDAGRVDTLRRKAEPVFDVTRIKAGAKYSVLSSIADASPAYLIYEKSLRDHVVFDLRDTMRVYEYSKEVIVRPEMAEGVITSSLWNAIRDSRADLALSDMMAEVYAWQIDFFGIDKGDSFKVLYNQAYIDDSVRLEIQNIRGALFRHEGKDYYAIPFAQDSIVEFFDEQGQSLRKAFLKAPLKFTRISSTFSNARRHPILKIVRPHHGVDYAAPVGTPVRSIGDGTIIKKAFQAGGAGYYLRVRHNASYESTYMHLSKFAAGIKEGSRVSQGQVIGYVGSTGGSTGPHLDFRVSFQGKPINPLKMQSPPSLPVRPELADSFAVVRDSIIRELKTEI
jgi:murein DD-endopeptidase MepM/ murein hydrolase activator NlpD